MWADLLCRERWQYLTRLCDGAADKAVYSETRQRLIEAIKEDKILGSAPSNERFKFISSECPNGAPAGLVALADQMNSGRAYPR